MSGKAHYEELDWYETPRYYDAIFDVDTDVEARFLEDAYAAHSSPPERARAPLRVLEPACGSGRLMVEMARRGWRPHGFDLTPEMVTFAASGSPTKASKGPWRAVTWRTSAPAAGSTSPIAW